MGTSAGAAGVFAHAKWQPDAASVACSTAAHGHASRSDGSGQTIFPRTTSLHPRTTSLPPRPRDSISSLPGRRDICIYIYIYIYIITNCSLPSLIFNDPPPIFTVDFQSSRPWTNHTFPRGDAAPCSVLQCVELCCNVLQCVVVCCGVLQCVQVRCSTRVCI